MMILNKIRTILNVLFMLLALVSIILYFTAKEDFRMFMYACGAAIVIKLMEFCVRFIKR